MLNSFLYLQKDSEQDNGLGSEKRRYSFSEDSPQGEWATIAEQMMVTFAESTHPIFRANCPEECLKAKVVENCRCIIAPTLRRLKLLFAQFCKLAQSLQLSHQDRVSKFCLDAGFLD